MKTALDTIVAPKAAFESLRAAPTWLLALLVSIVVITISSFITTPAVVHGLSTDWPNLMAKDPVTAALPPDQQQARLAIAVKFSQFVWVFSPIFVLFAVLIGTVIMVIFNALGRGDGSFGKYWAAQSNITLIAALGSLVLALIVALRGADSYTTAQSVQESIPSLGMLAPGTGKLHAFLSAFTPFSIWASALVIAALAVTGRVARVQAWLGGILTLLLPALIAAAFAK
ncbi:MAG TPA: hypothetical protein VMA98_05115 [Candidatus Acidoferrales bacterium]|nr:hypothetical protein [Candidatus Acidoferrales bacterium]